MMMDVVGVLPLNACKHYLGDLPGIRMEWSLKVTDADVRVRDQPVFWVGEPNKDNRRAFECLGNLLTELKCPAEIAEIQRAVSAGSVCQGIRLSSNGSYSLYLSYKRDEEPVRMGYSWKEGQAVRTDSYRFRYFSEPGERADPGEQVHAALRQGFINLTKDPAVLHHSGYWTQHENGRLKEVYITYPWHPPLQQGIAGTANAIGFFTAKRLETYAQQHFRHIGFSAADAAHAALTCYFSAPLDREWPVSFDDFQQKVSASGKILHVQLMNSSYFQN